MSFSLSSQFCTIEGSATGTKRTDTQAYVRYERETEVQEITTPIVDIPLTVPIQSSPTRQLL